MAQVANRAIRLAEEGQINMLGRCAGDMQSADDARAQLQFFFELAKDRRGWFFVFGDPAAGQPPGQTRMIAVFNEENATLPVKHHGSDANCITRLGVAVNQVRQPQKKRKTAQQSGDLSRHSVRLH